MERITCYFRVCTVAELFTETTVVEIMPRAPGQPTGPSRKRARRSSPDSLGSAGRAGPSMIMIDTSFVFMCKQCNVILAEGRSASIYNEQLDVIACLQATRAVRVDKEFKSVSSEGMQDCFYSDLKCEVCSAEVGRFLISAAADLAHLREMFCFYRTSIVCYSMQTKQMIEGSQINVNVSQCLTELNRLEEELYVSNNDIMQLGKLFGI